jgi:long-chain fatty acid transport protein
MKKFLVVLSVLALALVSVDMLFAGGVDYLSNQSAEYIRTLNRNGATDAADIANYNPAGLTKLKDGLYANVSNQTLFKTYKATDKDSTHLFNAGKDFEQTEPTYLLPATYIVYKQDNWAAFLNITVPQGGGKLIFEDGAPMVRTALYGAIAKTGGSALGLMAAQDVKEFMMESKSYAGTIGGSFAVNEMFSIALAGRIISGHKKLVGDANTKGALWSTADGTITNIKMSTLGYGAIIGVNVNPMPELNIGVRYETSTKMKWDVNTYGSSTAGNAIAMGLGYRDGCSIYKDLPALAAIGIEYKVNEQFTVGWGFTYYFTKYAEWKIYDAVAHTMSFGINTTDPSAYLTKTNKDFDNGYETGVTLGFQAMPELLISLGYLYTYQGSKDTTLMDAEIALDSNTFGIGAKYTVMEGVDINFGFSWTMYTDATSHYVLQKGSPSAATQNVDYKKDVKTIAIGAQMKI